MSRRLYLAFDQGTTATKAGLIDESGSMLAVARRRVPVEHPGSGSAESDPSRWWRGLVECIAELLASDPAAASEVVAVSGCGFMHTVVPTDADGHPLGPAILWSDRRISGIAGRGPRATCFERAAWWAARNANAADRMACLLPVKDHLRARLTGDFATDPYEADATGRYDLDTDAWQTADLAGTGFSPGQVPRILTASEVASTVSVAAAAETGLRAGTPVVTGTGDWMAVLIGSGSVLPSRACIYLGTAGVVGAFASNAQAREVRANRCFGAASATGAALDWIAGVVGGSTPMEELLAEAAAAPAGADGLVFLPFLAGERQRGHERGAGASFVGLTQRHSRGHVVRAVVEGAVAWLRYISDADLSAFQPGELLATGGGARGRLWLETVANVFGRPIAVPSSTESGLRGAAMLAARGIGASDLGPPEIAEVVAPADEDRRAYRALGEHFEELAQGVGQAVDVGTGAAASSDSATASR